MSDRLVATPGQTIGPFFGFALPYAGGEDLVPRSVEAALVELGLTYAISNI